MLTALFVATVTGLATGLGAIPFFLRDTIPRRAFDAILGLGAGIMISAATIGLLGHALESLRPAGALDGGVLVQVLAGFTAGMVAMMIMDRFIPHHHAGGHAEHIQHGQAGHPGDSVHPDDREPGEEVRQGLLVAGGMTIHRIPEGFAIGTGFAVDGGSSLGWMLAVAVAVANVCEGAVMGALLRHAGWSRARCLAVVSATGLAVPVAAVAGHLAGTTLDLWMPLVVSLASGALIYLISNEILPEAHSHGNEKDATVGLMLGFLVTIVVRALGHAH